MNTPKLHFGFSQKLIVIALLAAIGPVHADDDEVAQLIKPDRTVVSVGAAVVSGNESDRTIFGQYSGWRTHDATILLDVEMLKRDDATGIWTNFNASNLGLDNRELSYSRDKQGGWKYFADYSELVRHDPRDITTSVQGLGSTSPVILGATASRSTGGLDLKRKAFSLGGNLWISPNLMVEASFRSESKDGARLSGIGGFCSNIIAGLPCGTTVSALLLAAEPVDSTTQQLDVKLSYSGEGYNVNGGYYGSFFANNNGSLNPRITGNLVNADGTVLSTAGGAGASLAGYLQQPLALAPDNQAHQFYVDGNVVMAPWMNGNFHVAYTHAEQNQDFAGAGLTAAPGVPGNLGAKFDNYRIQAGVTAKPMPKLSMLANWRYEDKQDKTPLALYNGSFTNALNSSTRVNGKAEASYQLPDNLRATVGLDYEYMLRGRPVDTAWLPATSLTSLREWTEGVNYRIELRRSMSDTLNASISYVNGWRNGEHWLQLVPGTPRVRWVDIYTANGTFPMTMMDRKRDKLRAMADWMPMENLSLQFTLEDGTDRYNGRSEKGLHDTAMRGYGIDAAWSVSDAWKLTGYVNQGEQTLHVDHSWGYIAALKNTNTSVGLGATGKFDSKLDVGAELSYLDDKSVYDQTMGTGAAIVGALPDVTYRTVSMRVFGKYVLDSNASVRVDLIHQNVKFSEWTWGYNGTPFAFSDNSTVSMQPNQKVTFLGARYIYRFK